MARKTYRRSSSLFFLLFHLFSIPIHCSGTLQEFPSDGRSRGVASMVKTVSALKLNKDFPTQIQVLVYDQRVLNYLSRASVPVDIYLTHIEFGNRSSIKSLVSWLKTLLESFPKKLDIRNVVLSCNTTEFSQIDQLQMLLPFLRSFHSLLSRLQLEKPIKVTTSFPLPLLKSLAMKQKRELDGIFHFLRKTGSFVILEDYTGENLSRVDCLIGSLINKASVATSLLSHVEIPVVLTIKSAPFPNATEVSAFRDTISKSLYNLYEVSPLHRLQPHHLSHRALLAGFDRQGTKHDSTTSFPASPVTNPTTIPANLPPFSPTPTIITIPATNPVSVTPTNPPVVPLTNPVTTYPGAQPATNPVTTYPGAQPATNPVTTYPSPTSGVPVIGPVSGTNAPPIVGQTWCIARSGVAESILQQALDYACGIGKADCSMIQEGASCYNPNTLENHASYAFNSYFQKNPVASSCDFGGAAVLVNTNPSSDYCIYPSPTAASVPSSVSPATTASSSGATGSSYGAPPSVPVGTPPSIPIVAPPSVPMVPIIGSNSTSSSPTGYGSEYPPLIISPPSWSASVQPFTGIMALVTSLALGIMH